MTYAEFREVLTHMVDEIPGEFLEGLQAVLALEEEHPEPEYVDVWRMGEYLDIGPESFFGGGGGIGRHVVLYWGSFRRIAETDPHFDWEEEMWETLTHELRHHVESLAGDASLVAEDIAGTRHFWKKD